MNSSTEQNLCKGDGLLELGFGLEMLLYRNPYCLRRRSLPEYPNPSVPDVDQELKSFAGIAHFPRFQVLT
jgi:hypothetical protein